MVVKRLGWGIDPSVPAPDVRGDPDGISTRGERAMRRWIVWLVVVFVPLVLLVARNVQGATVFTEDITFVDGDGYWSVEIHEDAHAEVLGGRFGNRFQLYDDATATLLGGNFRGCFSMGDSSRATIHPGTYINTYIFMSGSAELDIFGGECLTASWTLQHGEEIHGLRSMVTTFSLILPAAARVMGS